MTESMLATLMKLFAILANFNRDVADILSRNFVESYLKTQFNQRIVDQSILFYDTEITNLAALENLKEARRLSALSVKILSICNQINQELHIKSKYLIIFSLIKFLKYFDDRSGMDEDFRQTISDTVLTISEHLQIKREEYDNCRTFINDKFYKVPHKENLLVISDIDSFSFTEINHLQKENLHVQLFFLKIQQAGIITFYYVGNSTMELGGRNLFPNHLYIFPKGASLKADKSTTIYFSDVEAGFLRKKTFNKVTYVADNIEFRFPGSENGIHKLSFAAESGDLIGIMGGSGVGKSTLLKVLNGIHDLKHGNIFINGHNLVSGKNELKGMIAYVPQDDLLIEELTVYQNLFYKARLCLGNLNDLEINNTVIKILNSLDLFYIKDYKVGSLLNKLISGGQRKRLNIALELIMEPCILFADEPTSGLSSTDSENVLQLLNELTFQGKIVFINIHQPSSELFKMLDKILILDKGGFPVYFGNPLDSFSYLKNITKRVDAADIECSCCGNVQPDEILKIIEAKHVNELGEFTTERLIPPEEWYELFLTNIQNKHILIPVPKTEIPSLSFSVPNRIRQFSTYSIRNFFTKLADKQYIMLALLISPLLAFVVSLFSKYFSIDRTGNPVYIFSNNLNLPSYIFMSVIIALFIGLIISAEDILKDRKTLEREKFLNLSKVSYVNSKIFFLFVLAAFQMLVYVLVGNHILEIKGMTFNYWLVLFSTSCFAIMLGLNISSIFKTAVAIYINIPFILVPLILLAGIIVRYDKIHYRLSSLEYVPVAGDLMASRWAYEALMVTQFKDNKYQQPFYSIDREMANKAWELNFLIPELNNKINDYESLLTQNNEPVRIKKLASLVLNTINEMSGPFSDSIPGYSKNHPTDSLHIAEMKTYLNNWRTQLIAKNNDLVKRKDKLIDSLRNQGISNKELAVLKEQYFNKSVADLVLNTDEMNKIIEFRGKLIRKDTPVYQDPISKFGRTRFYSGTKRIGSWIIDTFSFNIMILWLMTISLYLFLIRDSFETTLRSLRLSINNSKK